MDDIRELSAAEFPPLLREIADPPKTLFVKGSMPGPDRKFLTVVGSRRMSRYGKDACEHLIAGLSGYPVVIVSGLALGIDGVAHRAALSAGLRTIAVPGSGLSEQVLYPRAHLGLAREIVEKGGALVSEMKPDEPATPYGFPRRNRIMAGLSHATLVIEAGVKSGTLVTAKLTVDYNRELLAIPHSIFSESGAGGHLFMKLGAQPARSAADILEALGFEASAVERELPAMTPEEKRAFAALAEPMSRDELIRALGIPTEHANVLLASMELKGIIAVSGGEVRRNI
ncbi:MAG: DNA-processing protein DprA [Patescibacteria group bacterium]